MATKSQNAGTTTPLPRATSGKLTITFGMVTVGVGLAPMTDDRNAPSGHWITKDGKRVKQAWINAATGEVVERDALTIAFEYGDKLVRFEADELDALAAQGDGTIALRACVPVTDIDPLFYEKGYALWPQKASEQAYDLLREALHGSGEALVGTFTPSRSKSPRTLVIRWSDYLGCLVAHSCTYEQNVRVEHAASVRAYDESRPAVAPEMVEMARTILSALPSEFDPALTTDTYAEKLTAAIESKANGIEVEKVEAEPVKVGNADLFAALQASVAEAQARREAGEDIKATMKNGYSIYEGEAVYREDGTLIRGRS